MKSISLALGWMLVLLVLLSIPGQELPPVRFQLWDKFAHAGSFFVLGLLWMRSLRGSWGRRALITLAIGLVYGIGSEVYQGLMPIGRTFDPYDAAADFLGTLLAVGVYIPLSRKKAKSLSNREPFTVS